jgi:hypothetical protein
MLSLTCALHPWRELRSIVSDLVSTLPVTVNPGTSVLSKGIAVREEAK